MAVVSYGLKLKNAHHIFDKTIRIYSDAVHYISEIVMLHFEDIESSEGMAATKQIKQMFVERLIHSTKNNTAVYSRFNSEFYKFPSYLRREAIMTAIGIVSSYKALVKNWEEAGCRGRRPFFNRNQNVLPCFYRNNTFIENEKEPYVSLKLYNGSDWIWHTFAVRDSDFLYAYRNLKGCKKSAPVLVKRNHRYELRIVYEISDKSIPRFKKDKDVTTVLGVDLDINTDATCSVIHSDGTVAGQRFINSPVEKDRMDGLLNVIKKAQQHGSHKNRRLWRFVNNYNTAIAVRTASEIVRFAKESSAEVIVFEHLDTKGRKRGGKKQKLALWRKRDIQHRVEALAARCGIRVSYVCAVNTSRLAYDGSGKVLRGKEAGLSSYSLCRFTTGKVYNCDLSASKNIAARYFISALLKSFSEKKRLSVLAKVPELDRRTRCSLATLISTHAVLRTFKVSRDTAHAVPGAV